MLAPPTPMLAAKAARFVRPTTPGKASSSCLKMIVAQLMLVCSVVKYIGLLGLSCRCGGNDFVPDREAGGHLGSPLGCTDQMTTGPKVLPDVAESKQEPLSLPR